MHLFLCIVFISDIFISFNVGLIIFLVALLEEASSLKGFAGHFKAIGDGRVKKFMLMLFERSP